MGHAGFAIVGGAGRYGSKQNTNHGGMRINVVASPADIGKTIAKSIRINHYL